MVLIGISVMRQSQRRVKKSQRAFKSILKVKLIKRRTPSGKAYRISWEKIIVKKTWLSVAAKESSANTRP